MKESIQILLRANGYVIVNKSVGSDSEDKGEGSVPFLVRKTLGTDYASPCHRLDRAVSGAMLVCLCKEESARLCKEVQENKIQKEYICVCEGEFDQSELEGEMHDLLFFDRSRQKSFTVKKKRAGVKQASLEYSVLGKAQNGQGKTLSLVSVKLHTGRTHQIRVQFASRLHPICGDGKYGSHDNKCTIALHCLSLTVDGVRTECKPECKYPFDLFYTLYK